MPSIAARSSSVSLARGIPRKSATACLAGDDVSKGRLFLRLWERRCGSGAGVDRKGRMVASSAPVSAARGNPSFSASFRLIADTRDVEAVRQRWAMTGHGVFIGLHHSFQDAGVDRCVGLCPSLRSG